MTNLWKVAGVVLTISGGLLGMAADYVESRNRTEEALEEARVAAQEEVRRMYAVDQEQEEEEA